MTPTENYKGMKRKIENFGWVDEHGGEGNSKGGRSNKVDCSLTEQNGRKNERKKSMATQKHLKEEEEEGGDGRDG